MGSIQTSLFDKKTSTAKISLLIGCRSELYQSQAKRAEEGWNQTHVFKVMVVSLPIGISLL
jgi:hypothetical protein